MSVDAILADPLAQARASGRAIGHVGFDVPVEVLTASGRFACHLPWQADRATPRADGWLESAFPGWARSMLEDWIEGRFDFLEAVVFSRSDDTAQRLYYYVCELQRRGQIGGPEALVFDAARIGRTTSLDHCMDRVRVLAARLGAGGVALTEAIVESNARRARWAALEARGSARARLLRASLFAPVDLAAFAAPVDEPKGRVLLTGSVPPDERLHLAVEKAGWSVTGEANELALCWPGPAIDTKGDPAEAIGRHVHALGAVGFAEPGARLVADARRARVDAVVLWLTEEEEGRVWHVPAQRAALAAAGLPALVMTRRRWDCGDGAGEEIVAFLEGLK